MASLGHREVISIAMNVYGHFENLVLPDYLRNYNINAPLAFIDNQMTPVADIFLVEYIGTLSYVINAMAVATLATDRNLSKYSGFSIRGVNQT